MSKTEDFLKEAFAGESQANRKYQAFAAKADKEGYAQAAKLFRAASEDHEYEAMYPEMIETARVEKQKGAEMSFHDANEVEKVHSQLFNKLLANQGKSTETFPYYVCPICGNTVEMEPPGTCQVCGTEGKLFKRVD
jgi:rubrerythrin